MDLDKLRERVRDGEFQAITLDTSIFDSQGLKLESGLLKQLKQFRDSSTKLILSEIVKEEIFSHLKNKTEEVRKTFEKALKQIKEYWIIEDTEVQQAKDIVYKDQDASKKVAQNKLNKFIQDNCVQIIKAEKNVSISELIYKYFEAKPPFSTTGKKRNEFPDAIALMSLEALAKYNRTKIIAVTSDHDWINFCKESKYIVGLNDLGLTLGLFQLKDADDICEYFSERYERDGLEDIEYEILSSLNNYLDKIDFYLSPASNFLYEEEIENVTINSHEFNVLDYPNTIFRPVNYYGDYLVVESNLAVRVSVNYYFSFYVRDYVDKDYVSMGSKSITIPIDIDVDILISFSGDLNSVSGKIDIDSVEIVSETLDNLEIDEIEPDWE